MLLGLLVTLSVILLFVLLLILPVKLIMVLHPDGSIIIRYLFFKYRFDFSKEPEPQKAEKKPDAKAKQPKESYFKRLADENGILDAVLEILNIIGLGLKKLFQLLKHTKINHYSLSITVGRDDAAETAITYGTICAAVYPAVAAINGLFPVKKQEVLINADYKKPVFEYSFSAILSVRMFFVIIAIVSFLYRYFKLKLDQNNRDVKFEK